MRYKYSKYNFQTGLKGIKTKTFIAFSTLGLVLGGGAMSLAIFGSAHAANSNVVVNPSNMHGWTFFDDNGYGGSGSLVNGPATPLLGTGSAQLGLTAANQGYALGYGGYSGIKLSSLTSLSYKTYIQTGDNTIAPALQLNIDQDVTDATTGWFGRLIYEPYYTHTVTDGTWQTWNTMDDATSGSVGNWWFSNGGIASSTGCTQAAPCTWSAVLAATSDLNIGINATYPGVDFKAGSNWAVPFTGNVDAFTIGVSGNDTTYDFEAVSPVTAPTITYPANGAFKTTAQMDKVDWTDVSGATSYEYRSYTNASYTTLAYDSGFTLSASQIPTPGTPNGDYYLQVRAMDGDGNVSPWSNDSSTPYVVHVVALLPPPTTKDDCRNGNWEIYNNPSFKNKDKCIDYVVKHGHKASGDVTYTAYGLKREADFNVNTYNNNKGSFEYSDANHDWYRVKVSSVKVSGNKAYFAGVVTNSKNSHYNGNWLFAEVSNGHPDLIWGSFTDQTTALNGVANMTNPADGPFNVTHGNLEVN